MPMKYGLTSKLISTFVEKDRYYPNCLTQGAPKHDSKQTS